MRIYMSTVHTLVVPLFSSESINTKSNLFRMVNRLPYTAKHALLNYLSMKHSLWKVNQTISSHSFWNNQNWIQQMKRLLQVLLADNSEHSTIFLRCFLLVPYKNNDWKFFMTAAAADAYNIFRHIQCSVRWLKFCSAKASIINLNKLLVIHCSKVQEQCNRTLIL